MSAFNRGVRNAFRNQIRTFSIVLILSLSIGLALSMLLAHKAVEQKIQSVKSGIGNTITISPAGFSGFSQVNNALTSSQLSKVAALPHVTSLEENLTDRLTTIGSSQPSFGFSNNSSSSSDTNQTSLTSPITINTNGSGGGRFFINGGGSLPTNFSPPISIIGTNDPASVNGETLNLSNGTMINGSKDTDNALISAQMASKNSLKVGSTFTAYGTTLTVAGIFSTTNQGLQNNVIVALPTEQRLSGQSGDVTSATATVDSLDNLAGATSAVKSTLGSSADVESAQDQANATVQPLENIKSVSLYSLIGAVVAGAVIILLTMIMITRERRREIGVLKAIGASNVKVIWQFISEAVTFTLMAAVIGIIIGAAAAGPITNTLVSNSTSGNSATPGGATTVATRGFGGFRSQTGAGPSFVANGRGLGRVRSDVTNIHAAVGWTVILYGLGAALVIAVVGSSVAAWFIAKIRPAEVMRAE